jgi:hypothetical protein
MDGRLSRRTFFALVPGAALAVENGSQELEPSRGVGSWVPQLGTRRARIRVRAQVAAVSVRLRWRRRDHPADRDLHIVEAATGRRVRNLARVRMDRHQAELVFEPYGAGEYHVYFAPYTANRLPHAYAIQYTAPQDTADPAWVDRYRNAADLPRARVIDIQGRTEFDHPDPMEFVASEEETRSLLDGHPATIPSACTRASRCAGRKRGRRRVFAAARGAGSSTFFNWRCGRRGLRSKT